MSLIPDFKSLDREALLDKLKDLVGMLGDDDAEPLGEQQWPAAATFDGEGLGVEARLDRNPDAQFQFDGERVRQLDAKGQFVDACDDGIIVTLHPGWLDAAGNGMLIAEANEDDGPNPHLRYKQAVVVFWARPDANGASVMRDGGLGRPDEQQNTDGHSYLRLKRYNETRGQVLPVRLEDQGEYRIHVEMRTPSGTIRTPTVNVTVGAVHGSK